MRHNQPPIAKKKQVIELQSYLSLDLIIQEILARLPVKSILRFKSVSKQWYSTLSSANFASAHFMKSSLFHPSAPVNTLFIQSGKNYYLFSYNDDPISGNFDNNLVKLDPELRAENEYFLLTGCSNGLVCLTAFPNKYFIIWNPVTRKMRRYEFETDFGNDITGFGYASSVDDYKYVQLGRVYGTEKYSISAHIFSLRKNKWRKIDFDCNVSFHIGRGPMIVNEKLNWVGHCSQAGGRVTASFDLGAETVEVVKGGGFHLGDMGGCLSKCNSHRGDDILMHIFESHALVKSIGLSKELKLGMCSEMIGFTRTGKFFVTGLSEDELHMQCKTLGIVDASTKPVQYTRLLKFDKEISIARFVPSLVSPFPIEEELSRA